jgi:MFS family permease
MAFQKLIASRSNKLMFSLQILRNKIKVWNKFPTDLWILIGANVVNTLGTTFLSFLVLYLTQHMKFTPTQAADIFSLYGLVAIVAGPLAGKLGDRYGTLTVQKVLLLCAGIILIMFPLAKTLTAIVVLTIIYAFCSEGYRAVNIASITLLAPIKNRATTFAITRVCGSLALAFATTMAGLLATYNFIFIYFLDGITSLVAVLVMMRIMHLPRPKPSPDLEKIILRSYKKIPFEVILFYIAAFLVALVMFQAFSTLPLHLTGKLEFSTTEYGAWLAFQAIFMTVLEIPIVRLTQKWSHSTILSTGVFCVGCGFGLLSFANADLFLLAILLWSTGAMLYYPRANAFIAEIAPEGKIGSYVGTYMMVFSIALFAAPFFGIRAYTHFGHVVFWSGTFIFCLASAMIIGLTKSNKVSLRTNS